MEGREMNSAGEDVPLRIAYRMFVLLRGQTPYDRVPAREPCFQCESQLLYIPESEACPPEKQALDVDAKACSYGRYGGMKKLISA